MKKNIKLKTENDIRKLLTSNLSYDEKLEILRSEKQKAINHKDRLEKLENNFENNEFIEGMQSGMEELKDKIKLELPVAAISTSVSCAGLTFLSIYLKDNKLTDMSVSQTITTVFGTFFAPVISVLFTASLINDFKKYLKYQKEMNAFQKRLKK